MVASEAGGLRLPNVLVIGAQKCGTTALHALLAGHPEIFGSAQKEPDFFSRDRKGDLARYARLFEGAGDARVVMESSTSYSMFPVYSGTARRVATALEGVKLLYLMREPFERMRASYIGTVSTGKERRPIRLALLHGMDFYLYPSLYAHPPGQGPVPSPGGPPPRSRRYPRPYPRVPRASRRLAARHDDQPSERQ